MSDHGRHSYIDWDTPLRYTAWVLADFRYTDGPGKHSTEARQQDDVAVFWSIWDWFVRYPVGEWPERITPSPPYTRLSATQSHETGLAGVTGCKDRCGVGDTDA